MIDLNNPIPTHRLFNHLSWQQLSHTISTYSQWRRGLHQLPDWCVQWTHLFNRLSLLNTEILPTFSGDDANDGSHDLSQTTPQRFERSHMIIWQNPSPSMPSCALWTLCGWGKDGAERYTKSWDGIGVFYEPKEKFTSIIAWICSDWIMLLNQKALLCICWFLCSLVFKGDFQMFVLYESLHIFLIFYQNGYGSFCQTYFWF